MSYPREPSEDMSSPTCPDLMRCACQFSRFFDFYHYLFPVYMSFHLFVRLAYGPDNVSSDLSMRVPLYPSNFNDNTFCYESSCDMGRMSRIGNVSVKTKHASQLHSNCPTIVVKEQRHCSVHFSSCHTHAQLTDSNKRSYRI